MPINPMIALQTKGPEIEPPMNSMMRVLQLQGLQGEQEARQFDMGQKRSAAERQSRMDQILSGGGDSAALRHGGFLKESLEWDKAADDRTKSQAAAGKDSVETEHKAIGIYRDASQAIGDPQSAAAFLTMMHSDPRLKNSAIARVPLDQLLTQIPQDPAKLGEWKQQFALGATKFMELNKPQYVTSNVGDRTVTTGIAGLTGVTTPVQTIQNTQSPDNAANNARQAADNAAARAIQWANHGVSQQNLTVAQQRLQMEKDKEARERAAEQSSGAPVLGVPAPKVLPWANQTLPKDANKVKAQEQTRGAKEIEKDIDAAIKAEANAAEAKRFVALNKNTGTGGVVDKLGVTRWAQGMGNDYSEMEAITARLAPQGREPGSGSSSDLDVKMFERATVGVDKPSKTNANIAAALDVKAKQARDYAEFRQTYLEQNGTLQGADRHWKDYVNKNPIFAKESESFDLNPRRQTWVEHFRAQTQPRPKPAAPAPATTKPGVVDFGSLPGG